MTTEKLHAGTVKNSRMTEQETIATIMVNQRIMRNGSPPIVNALDLLPQELRDEVMDDAQAIIDGLKAAKIVSEIADNGGIKVHNGSSSNSVS